MVALNTHTLIAWVCTKCTGLVADSAVPSGVDADSEESLASFCTEVAIAAEYES